VQFYRYNVMTQKTLDFQELHCVFYHDLFTVRWEIRFRIPLKRAVVSVSSYFTFVKSSCLRAVGVAAKL
jgi:hypothetical protein